MSISTNALQTFGVNANRSQMSHGQRFPIKTCQNRVDNVVLIFKK